MEIVLGKLSWPFKLQRFLQLMVNRLMTGEYRYGKPASVQDYLTRLEHVIEKYKSTGNLECLVDAANYCCLEFNWPLHPGAHFKSQDSRGSKVLRDITPGQTSS